MDDGNATEEKEEGDVRLWMLRRRGLATGEGVRTSEYKVYRFSERSGQVKSNRMRVNAFHNRHFLRGRSMIE